MWNKYILCHYDQFKILHAVWVYNTWKCDLHISPLFTLIIVNNLKNNHLNAKLTLDSDSRCQNTWENVFSFLFRCIKYLRYELFGCAWRPFLIYANKGQGGAGHFVCDQFLYPYGHTFHCAKWLYPYGHTFHCAKWQKLTTKCQILAILGKFPPSYSEIHPRSGVHGALLKLLVSCDVKIWSW